MSSPLVAKFFAFTLAILCCELLTTASVNAQTPFEQCNNECTSSYSPSNRPECMAECATCNDLCTSNSNNTCPSPNANCCPVGCSQCTATCGGFASGLGENQCQESCDACDANCANNGQCYNACNGCLASCRFQFPAAYQIPCAQECAQCGSKCDAGSIPCHQYCQVCVTNCGALNKYADAIDCQRICDGCVVACAPDYTDTCLDKCELCVEATCRNVASQNQNQCLQTCTGYAPLQACKANCASAYGPPGQQKSCGDQCTSCIQACTSGSNADPVGCQVQCPVAAQQCATLAKTGAQRQCQSSIVSCLERCGEGGGGNAAAADACNNGCTACIPICAKYNGTGGNPSAQQNCIVNCPMCVANCDGDATCIDGCIACSVGCQRGAYADPNTCQHYCGDVCIKQACGSASQGAPFTSTCVNRCTNCVTSTCAGVAGDKLDAKACLANCAQQ